MFCLLCHEKVPRLRAWRTKSEFCCDEHAELYKRQTLERLLTDQQDDDAADALPLPLDNRRPRREESVGSPEEESTVAQTLARFAETTEPLGGLEERLGRQDDAQPLGGQDRDEGVQELWRLAEEVGPGAGGGDDDWASLGAGLPGEDAAFKPSPFGGPGGRGGSGDITEQTAEEALAALRELSGGSRRSGGAALEDSGTGNGFDALVAARDAETARRSGPVSRAANLEEVDDLPAALDEALPDEDSLPPLDMGALEPLDDDELPSILDRLTENDPPGAELHTADEPAELLEDEQPLSLQEEPAAEDVSADDEQPEELAAAPVEEPFAEEVAEETATQESGAAELAEFEEQPLDAAPDDSSASDLFAEAVESHLEEAAEKPAGRDSRKVVPFPLTKREPQPSAESEAAGPKPAAASDSKDRAAKSGLPKRKGKTGNLNRVNMKPVTVMFGLEPSLAEPAPGAGQDSAGLAALPGQNALAESPVYYPQAAKPRSFGARLPVHGRLYPVLPELPESPSLFGEAERPDGPDYSLPCIAPPPLALRANGKQRAPSVGSERAWMVQIEPTLAEAAEMDIVLPNGNNHTPWKSPLLPAALLAGMSVHNGSGKLDLSGPAGRHEPPIDRLCLVLPELGELGASPKQPSSKGHGGESVGWMPPSVLDPRFDIERPVGRDLSDFG